MAAFTRNRRPTSAEYARVVPVRVGRGVLELEQEPGIGDRRAGAALILLDPGPVRAVPELGVGRVRQVVDLRGQVVGVPVDLAAAAGDQPARRGCPCASSNVTMSAPCPVDQRLAQVSNWSAGSEREK